MIGRQEKVGIKLELTWGVEDTGAEYLWLPMKEPKLSPKVDYIEDDSGVGIVEAPLESDVVGKFAELQLNQIIYDKAIGHFLRGAFGAVASVAQSAPNDSVYDHTFTVNQDSANDLPSFTIVFKNGLRTKKMTGCTVNVYEQVTENKQYIMANVALFGKFPVDTTETATYLDAAFGTRFNSTHTTLRFADTVTELATADCTAVENIKFTIENNLTPIWEGGHCIIAENLEPVGFEAGTRRIKGDASVKWRAMDKYNEFSAGTQKSLEFILVNNSITIGDDQNPTLVLTLSKTKTTEWDHDTSLDDVVKETFGFVGHFYLAEGFMHRAVLTNEATEY